MNEHLIPKDFSSAVKDIKLAILRARACAARVANVEALKLYFYVGGYVSKKTRSAKWGTGAIDALSERLQVELPGLRGFSPSGIKRMRLFFEAWESIFEIRPLPMVGSETGGDASIRPLAMVELGEDDLSAFLSVGFTHHSLIVEKVKDAADRWYYIRRCAQEHLTVLALEQILRSQEHWHIGTLANNFAKTLSPMSLAMAAVRSFKDEYLLDLVNLDIVLEADNRCMFHGVSAAA